MSALPERLQGMRGVAALLLAGGLLVPGQGARGFVPDADRVTKALAAVNKSSGRAQALRFDLEMRIGDGDVIAIGELVTHPTGLARLELRGSGGLVERHVLQGSLHQASRNGVRLDQYRAFLPPLFLLQADTKVTLEAALDEFGVRADVIGLAACGESNCYVLGDPGRVATPPGEAAAGKRQPVEEVPGFDSALGAKAEPSAPGAAPIPAGEVLGSFATIWVDIVSLDVLRIESKSGVRTTLGPTITTDGVRTPSWILIEEPGQSLVRFDITGVTPVNAPAVAFGQSWLLAPLGREDSPPVDPQRS